ncbi:sugar ABC transporter substrate-binding protein [Cellulomonas sp. ATA003]|uniref:ABC transporter substrate-binding protein n=1 Tax=Cellulomonas sp. ATA003 TaxID=3073064 RepID=UPI002873A3F2|nr:sugar ABC transporter substrate-binding protein [Cellulomonas sp. ATA003]WNB86609.1 sugar ABC transporter substrate-binding protein [Cellulomonas sp. ATA003]
MLAIGSLALTACGQGEEPDAGAGDAAPATAADPDAPAEIRFSWWGADVRHQRHQKIIDAFEAENPNIDVVPDFTDWGGYWDKLATVTAGGDTPDVFMQEDRYIREYAERGVLRDLSDLDIATEDLDPTLLAAGQLDDAQYGIPTGSNVYSVIANPDLFEAAGVALPDDTEWTWDEYVDIAQQISDGTPEGVYGTSDYTYNETGLMVYLRQHGQNLYDEDGELGYEDELLEEWFQRSLDMQASGAQPGAAEALGLPTGQTFLATNKAAMEVTWSAQLGILSDTAGTQMEILRVPGESEFDRTGMYFKPGMYMSMSADTEYPDAAAAFIDYFINSVEVGEKVLSDLGLPANATVREAIADQLTPNEQIAAEFIADLQDEVVDAPPSMPVGAGEVASIIKRINEEVLFERLTPEQAADQFRTEVEAVIGG